MVAHLPRQESSVSTGDEGGEEGAGLGQTLSHAPLAGRPATGCLNAALLGQSYQAQLSLRRKTSVMGSHETLL